MQTSKQQLITLLKRTGSVTVEEAAGALSVASMTARQHLVGLERDGLVRSEKVRRAMGSAAAPATCACWASCSSGRYATKSCKAAAPSYVVTSFRPVPGRWWVRSRIRMPEAVTEATVMAALRQVEDPELHRDIVSL